MCAAFQLRAGREESVYLALLPGSQWKSWEGWEEEEDFSVHWEFISQMECSSSSGAGDIALGSSGIMLNQKLVATHVDRCLLSYDPSVWKHLNAVKEATTFFGIVLGSIVHLVVANHAVVQN